MTFRDSGLAFRGFGLTPVVFVTLARWRKTKLTGDGSTKGGDEIKAKGRRNKLRKGDETKTKANSDERTN